jgi:hypothetical protein
VQLGQKPCSATQASVTDRAVWVGLLKDGARLREAEITPRVGIVPHPPTVARGWRKVRRRYPQVAQYARRLIAQDVGIMRSS